MPTTGGVRTLGRVLRLQVPQIPRELDYLAGKHMHNLSRNLTSYGNRKLAEAARIDAARRAAVGKSYEGAPVESLVEIRKGLRTLIGNSAPLAARDAKRFAAKQASGQIKPVQAGAFDPAKAQPFAPSNRLYSGSGGIRNTPEKRRQTALAARRSEFDRAESMGQRRDWSQVGNVGHYFG